MKTPMFWNRFPALFVMAIAVTLFACSPSPVSFPEPDPHAFESKSNLAFHQISWEYFLWLTSEAEDGKLVFETMYTDAAITPESKDDTNHILGGVQQANSEGILVDRNGRAVYTTMMINDAYRDFVLDNKLYDAKSLLEFTDTTSFPVGALSLKAEWKIVADGEDTTGMYTTDAEIKLLTDDNGSIGIPENPETQKGVRVALVGFHIAIVVNGHPEAIWATFEHVRNAPYVADGQLRDKSVSEESYTFYAAKTEMKDCNVNGKPVLSLDAATQKLAPINQVALQYRLGGGSSVNQNNIDQLNAKMHNRLAADSIWRNYFEVGAVWFVHKNVLRPNWNPNSGITLIKKKRIPGKELITGSTKLSNSVIETFTQAIDSENECFSCHNTMSLTAVPSDKAVIPGKNVLTSHILLQNYLADSRVKR